MYTIRQHPERFSLDGGRDPSPNELDVVLDAIPVGGLIFACILSHTLHRGDVTIGFLDRPAPDDNLAFFRLHHSLDGVDAGESKTNDYGGLADSVAATLLCYTNYSGRVAITIRSAPEAPTLLLDRGSVKVAIEFGESAFDSPRHGLAKPGTSKQRRAWEAFRRQSLLDPVIHSVEISEAIAGVAVPESGYRGRLLWALNRSASNEHGVGFVACVALEDIAPKTGASPRDIAPRIAERIHSLVASSFSYAGNLVVLFPDCEASEPYVHQGEHVNVVLRFGPTAGSERALMAYDAIMSEWDVR